MRAHAFFGSHPVFTVDEFATFHGGGPEAAANLLAYHARAGNVTSVRRGVYAVVPEGGEPGAHRAAPWLVASRLFEGGVISHGSALRLHRAQAAPRTITVTTPRRTAAAVVAGHRYVPVLAAKALRDRGAERGVEELAVAGGTTRVTTRARTVVDLLGAPRRAGGLRKVWAELAQLDGIEAGEVAEEALAREGALLAALVGYWLERQATRLRVRGEELAALEAAAPKGTVRVERVSGGRYVARWKLVVPPWMLAPTPGPSARPAVPLTAAALTLLGCLDDRPQTADELFAASGLPIAEVLASLTLLELHGACEVLPGRRFVRAPTAS